MKISSPLRYPGGKAGLAHFLARIRFINRLGDRSVTEPFAGGAGASLTLLYSEEANEIFINDADRSIHDFWWSVVNRSKSFIDMLDRTPLTIDEWYRQRLIYRHGGKVSRLQRGFAAFYLNRCNRSGIIMNGGPIGGINQIGQWKLSARFNKQELRKRVERIAEYGDRIHISGVDGLKLLDRFDSGVTFFFIDPPYYEKGRTVYLNSLQPAYHVALANRLRTMTSAWVLTYDDCPQIRKLYRDWASIKPFVLRYSAGERRTGHELLITPKWMSVPESGPSAAIIE